MNITSPEGLDWRWPNFAPREFACACCRKANMDPGFMGRLQRLRVLYGKPISITSGYRCPAHNAKVSKTGATGPHTTGRAVDIPVARGEAFRLMKLALELGFTGFGFKQHGESRFLHLDDLPDAPGQPRPTIWSYP